MGPISVMIKPAGGLCNMRCKYCFYQDEMVNRAEPGSGIMSEATLEAVLKKVLAHAEHRCVIAFQGGEPTLAGLDFFRRVVELEKRYNVNRCTIDNAIQTNGLAISHEWAAFFAENRFLVGVSLDGIKEQHDRYRLDAQGKGTFGRVLENIRILEKHHVDFNILTVVTGPMARHCRKAHNFFKEQGFSYQQYIPCIDPLGEVRGSQAWSLTPKAMEQYLKTTFDCWYLDAKAGNAPYNRYFDDLLQILAHRRPGSCTLQGGCPAQLVVEADGSVYPCDFYALDPWKLGNLNDHSMEEILASRERSGFSRIRPHPDCLQCKWAFLCRGGCRRDRSQEITGPLGKNYYCESYQHFFEYAYPRLLEIARGGTV